jgi:hypothetical protein
MWRAWRPPNWGKLSSLSSLVTGVRPFLRRDSNSNWEQTYFTHLRVMSWLLARLWRCLGYIMCVLLDLCRLKIIEPHRLEPELRAVSSVKSAKRWWQDDYNSWMAKVFTADLHWSRSLKFPSLGPNRIDGVRMIADHFVTCPAKLSRKR